MQFSGIFHLIGFVKLILVELTTLRSRLSKLEATKAEVDLELRKTENQLETDAERFEAEIQNNQERQRQGLISRL